MKVWVLHHRPVQTAILVAAFSIALSGLEAPVDTPAQTTEPLKVAAACRATLVNQFGQKAVAREPDVLLVVRIEGMSLAEFQKLSTDRLILQAGDVQYPATYRYGSPEVENFKDGRLLWSVKPWIVIAFSIPMEAANLKLVVGDYPPVAFHPAEGLLETASVDDLRRPPLEPFSYR